MGGFNPLKVFTAPTKWVSNAITHIADNPLDIIPATIGVATGNPWLAAATAGGTAAVRGGSAQQIFTSAAMTGLGGAAGNALGNTPMYVSRYLGGSEMVQSALTGFGAHVGSSAYQRILNQQRMASNIGSISTPEAPSMEAMRERAIVATRDAFTSNGLHRGMYGVSSRYMKKLNKQRPSYGYREWKELVRPQNYHA